MILSISAARGKVKGAARKFSRRRHRLVREVKGFGFAQSDHHGELLDDPRARAVFQRRFGKWMKHPMVGAARSLTLEQLAEMAAVYLPQKVIQDTLRELRQL